MATRGQLSIFFKGQYFMATHTGSTVNPVLGVNILSFTAEGESIYVQDMFCLLIGCGNAWGQNSSDTTPILAKVIYFEDRRGERNWNRPCESIMRKSKKSGITDFLSMNSPVWAGQLPPWLRCCPAPESEDAVVALCGANCNLWHRGTVVPLVCGACGCRVARAPTEEGRPNMAPHSTHVANKPHLSNVSEQSEK